MKTKIIDRILILSAYYIFRVVTVFFGIAFIITFGCYVIKDQVPEIMGYIFWFSFGAFAFGITVKKSFSFLDRKHEEKDVFYFDLLRKKDGKYEG